MPYAPVSLARQHDHADGHDHADAHGHAEAHDHARGHDHGHAHARAGDRGHAHAHERAHDHGHAHAPPRDAGRAFVLGIALNTAFVVVEAVFGVLSHSTALLADASHNLGDVLGLGFAWAATVLARRVPTARLTYGMRRSTILAALANAMVLMVTIGGVAWEAIGRLGSPPEVQSVTMMIVASIGVAVNGASALLFLEGREKDANVRAAFLHLVADAAVSVGVVAAGAILWATGWRWVDPVVSLVVCAVILRGTWRVLRDALHLSLDGVPAHIDLEAVRAHLAALPEVCSVHDLHVWAMSTTDVALTAHLVVTWPEREPAFLATLERELLERFGIEHVTVQLESSEGASCKRAEPGSV